MPRKTYGQRRRRPTENNGALLARLERELHEIPEWQQRRAAWRASLPQNRPERTR